MTIERDELKKAVFAAIEKLPANERIIVTLFYLKEQSHSDISAFLEVFTHATHNESSRLPFTFLLLALSLIIIFARQPTFLKKLRKTANA